MLFRKKRNRFRFTEKVHSKKGMVALGIAGISLLMYLIFLYISFRQAGNLSTYYGSAGVLFILVTIVAFVLSIQSKKEENSFKLFPNTALIVSIISGIFWIGTYVMGFII